ncbi:hypothetical protein ACQPXH_07000 [Nocardia sp. CA-135953]
MALGASSVSRPGPLRQWGAYAAIVDGAADDTAVAELLRYLGGDPQA